MRDADVMGDGIYKSADAGRTWQRVLLVDENTGCSSLDIDPKDPNVLVAGMRRTPHPLRPNHAPQL